MAKWNPIIETISSWSWWATVDEYAWRDNSFWFSYNIDSRSNSREIKLSPYINNLIFTASHIPMAMYWLDTSLICVNNNWTINWNGGSSSLVWKTGIRNMIEFGKSNSKPNLFVLSNTAIHLIEYDSSSLPWNRTYDQRTFNKTTNYRPALVFKYMLLLWDWDKIVRISSDGWTTTSLYTPSSWALSTTNIIIDLKNPSEYIIKIFELWDQVVFFTNRWQYFWDWFNNSYDRFVPRDEPIITASQYKTMFRVITKWPNYITLRETSSWYDRIPVFKDDIWSVPQRLRCSYSSDNNIITSEWITYWWGWYNSEIFSYGSFNPWMPNTLELQNYSQNFYYTTALYDSADWNLYFWYYTWWTYNVWYMKKIMDNKDYDSYNIKDWLIMFTPILWTGRWQDKEMVKYRVWYKMSLTWKIAIYSKINDETDRITFFTQSTTITPTVWVTYSQWSTIFTVISTQKDINWWTWIYAQITTDNWLPTKWWTITKISWTGDATISYESYVNMRLIWWIDWADSSNTSKYKYMNMYNELFNKIQFAVWLHTTSSANSPRINDFTWEYNQITNDL